MPLDPRHKKTYQIRAPLATHWRSATCEEVECEFFVDGWRLRVENLTERDLYKVKNSGRHCMELPVAEGETWLVFGPGTPCLRQWAPGQPLVERHHRLPVGRPELYVVRPGDWRLYTGESYRFDRGDQWRDDFAEHQDRLADRVKKG